MPPLNPVGPAKQWLYSDSGTVPKVVKILFFPFTLHFRMISFKLQLSNGKSSGDTFGFSWRVVLFLDRSRRKDLFECFLTDFSRFHHHFGGGRRRNFSVIQSTFHGFPAYPLPPPPGYIEACFFDQRFSNANSKAYNIFSIEKCANQSCCWAHTLTKGQLISECLFEKIVWTKIPPKNLIDSALV